MKNKTVYVFAITLLCLLLSACGGRLTAEEKAAIEDRRELQAQVDKMDIEARFASATYNVYDYEVSVYLTSGEIQISLKM